ncbi:FxsA family protein [Oceanibaculum indicum]|uniref:Phage T7 F exclusion suppressor FxsA n=1 Tax=Oceanibaculum indicum P24 TaxID=1207063 RepID=K2K6K7_9PROT|nr:FxsA family protein [Oceanibaculum indicum]EKE78489.1 phage T7 F exclusion suppressor FxsA [Oceanibaculum indicum P24]
MPLLILALLIGIPLVEIALFIEIGEEIGVWPTIGLCIATALAGSLMLRVQGLSTLTRARTAMARDEMPVREMLDGIGLAIAGAMLLTPGFATDTVGLLLFIPAIRRGIGRWLWRSLVKSGRFHVVGTPFPGGPRRGGPIIDGDYRDITETEGGQPGNPDSPWRQLPDANAPDTPSDKTDKQP